MTGREQSPCACGEMTVAADGSHRTELDGISHGLTPCFVCDTYGVSFNAPLTPDQGREQATPEDRIALALTCLEPVYRLVAEAEQRRRWWRRPSGPSIGTLILAERVRRALTDDY